MFNHAIQNTDKDSTRENPQTKISLFTKGALKILPLSFAVLPWGLLAGSMSIEAGLSPLKALAMSAFIFAGAAQLMILGLVATGTPVFTIMLSVFLITTQHYLYALYLRESIRHQPLKKRALLGFLLTDELFAISSTSTQHSIYYLLGAGSCFYLSWVLFTLCGIVLASAIPNLNQYHLDFSIVATFIAIVVPFVKNLQMVVGVLVSVSLTLILLHLGVKSAAIVAGVVGMLIATLLQYCRKSTS